MTKTYLQCEAFELGMLSKPKNQALTQPTRAPSTSSDAVLDLHVWGSTEFDSADEEGGRRSETSSLLSETPTESNVATGSTQVTDSAQAGGRMSTRSEGKAAAREDVDLRV